MKKLLTFCLLLTVVNLFGQQYHESDKEGLRRFLRQGQNLYGAQLSASDTINWYTSEAWVGKIKSNEVDNRNACTWAYVSYAEEYANRIVKLDFSGYAALSYNFTGSFDGGYFPLLESLSFREQYMTSVYLDFNHRLSYLNLSYMDTSEGLELWLPHIGVESRNESLGELYLSNTPMRNGALGLELFFGLRILECENSRLSHLSFWANSRLEVIKCYGNNFTNFSSGWYSDTFQSLKIFQCSGGSISNSEIQSVLDKALNLEEFSVPGYALQQLDLTKNTKLKSLNVYNNKLKSLNLNFNPDLKNLNCSNNELSSLNLNYQTKLEELNCGSNKLTSLNVKGKSLLKKLSCGSNNLTSINLEGLTALTDFNCSNNTITSLYLKDLKLMSTFNCSNNKLSDLNLNDNVNLAYLYCNNNNIQYLDCSANPKLRTLNCNYNNIEHISIADLSKLSSYNLSNNYLKFSTLPLLTEGRMQVLSPQKDFDIYCYVNEGSNFGHLYDLMPEYYVYGKYSGYSWYDTNGNIVPDIEDGAGEGMFSIPARHIGETIIFKVVNANFPKLTLKFNVHVVGASKRKAALANSNTSELVALDVNTYPNPVTDVLNISANVQISKIYVFDAAGRVLLTSGATNTLNVGGLTSGLHLLKIVFENGEERVVKFNKR